MTKYEVRSEIAVVRATGNYQSAHWPTPPTPPWLTLCIWDVRAPHDDAATAGTMTSGEHKGWGGGGARRGDQAGCPPALRVRGAAPRSGGGDRGGPGRAGHARGLPDRQREVGDLPDRGAPARRPDGRRLAPPRAATGSGGGAGGAGGGGSRDQFAGECRRAPRDPGRGEAGRGRIPVPRAGAVHQRRHARPAARRAALALRGGRGPLRQRVGARLPPGLSAPRRGARGAGCAGCARPHRDRRAADPPRDRGTAGDARAEGDRARLRSPEHPPRRGAPRERRAAAAGADRAYP